VTLEAMFFGAFFGLISAVAIYHLLMYAILRAPEFLSYGAYLAALAIFQLGREPKYLGVLGIAGDANVILWWSFSALAFLGYGLFRSFLMPRARQPRLERAFFYLACVFAVLALFAPWQPQFGAYVVGLEGLALAQLVVAGWALVVALRQRIRVATYFGIAYAGFFAGSLMWFGWNFASARLGPAAPVFEYGLELGTVFQALTLALGLADRIAAANEERDRAQRRTIDEISSLNVAYARFVPRTFLDLLGKEDVRDVHLGDGIEREMTVLFSDVRSFTTISESLTPNETFGFINGLLSRTGPVVREHGGIVDKYVGDAIMALFPRSADDGVRAAIALQSAVREHNIERAARNLPPIAVGVGLHVGSLMLGTIGEHERMDGTVIADAVNVASRVEGLTKYFGARVIVTDEIRAALDDPGAYAMRYLGRVAVMGKRHGIGLYEVLDGDPPERRAAKRATAVAFAGAVTAFVAGSFADAAERFTGVLHGDDGDGAARYLHGRALELAASGAPWEGVDQAAK
jgi:two-component system, sensor histidine kinase LadS